MEFFAKQQSSGSLEDEMNIKSKYEKTQTKNRWDFVYVGL